MDPYEAPKFNSPKFSGFKLPKCFKTKTLWFAVLIVVLIGALLAVQQYIRRGIMGRAKEATDDISGTQFEPAISRYTKVVNSSSHTNEVANTMGTTSTLLGNEYTNTTTNMEYTSDGSNVSISTLYNSYSID